jgi:class 3 adenylate cyclase
MPSVRSVRRLPFSARAELNRKNEAADKPALAARIAIDSGPVVVGAGAGRAGRSCRHGASIPGQCRPATARLSAACPKPRRRTEPPAMESPG